jgi:hypothetical protein
MTNWPSYAITNTPLTNDQIMRRNEDISKVEHQQKSENELQTPPSSGYF